MLAAAFPKASCRVSGETGETGHSRNVREQAERQTVGRIPQSSAFDSSDMQVPMSADLSSLRDPAVRQRLTVER